MKGKINGIFSYSSSTFSTYSSSKERQIKNEHHINLDTVFDNPILD